MILAIETSCDDSAIALIGMDGTLIANEISSQIDFHEKYGGVVPEIASRQHSTTLPLMIRFIQQKYNVNFKDLKAIAVTYAPGLIGSLLVGVSYAKTLAWVHDVPLIPVDHLEGHLLAPFLDNPDLQFPYLGMIASGGHSHLVVAKGLGNYELLGKTIDDAAGEAFDKTAKMLGFKYPGGPIIDRIAAEYPSPDIKFPIPLQGKKTLNFSFSGLKTAVRNAAMERGVYKEKEKLISYDEFQAQSESDHKNNVRNIAASFQSIMNKIIYRRFDEALKKTGLKRIAITGGVAANDGIKKALGELAKKRKINFYHPTRKNCTDNAAMIANVALRYYIEGRNIDQDFLKLNASPRSPLSVMPLASVD